jgi:hypothetical protein
MKKNMMGVTAALLAIMALAAACGTTSSANNPRIQTDAGKNYATIREVANLFKNENGSLTINNQASFDVIIFAGKVANNNVMGAISAGKSRSFDLSKLDLPANKGSFIIRAATFERYYNKARITEENILYTGLVVYDLADSKDRTNLNIFAGIQETEETYIYVSNTSKFVLELRLGTPSGEKLATLPPLMTNKKVYLSPAGDGMPYDFYPTYVYIDSSTNEQKSFTSRGMESRVRRIPAASGVNPMAFEGPKDTSEIGYLVAFLRVKNDTNSSFNFNDGTTWLADQKGRRLVESSPNPAVFELPALSRDQGQMYTNLRMEFDDGRNIRLNQVSLIPGYVYDVLVTESSGNYAYDVRQTDTKDKLEDMQISLFFGD